MAYSIVSPFGQRIFDALEPWQTDSLAMYVDALGSLFDPVAGITYDVGNDGDDDYIPGWGAPLDATLADADALPYLGQFVGVEVPVGASETTARALVRAESGKSRGTYASVRAAIERSISTPWLPNTAYLAGVLVSYDQGMGTVYYKVTTGFTSGSSFSTTNLAVTAITAWYQLFERTNASLGTDAYQFYVKVRPEQLTPVSDTTALLAAINATKPAGVLLNLVVSDSPRYSEATKIYSAVGGGVTYSNVSTGDV